MGIKTNLGEYNYFNMVSLGNLCDIKVKISHKTVIN